MKRGKKIKWGDGIGALPSYAESHGLKSVDECVRKYSCFGGFRLAKQEKKEPQTLSLRGSTGVDTVSIPRLSEGLARV